MKKISAFFTFTLLVLLLIFSGCNTAYQIAEFTAMDTYVALQVEKNDNGEILRKAQDLIKNIENKFSVTLPSSEISVLNISGEITASEETLEIINLSKLYSEKTGGAIDITVYPIVKAWGFTTGTHKILSQDDLNSLLPNVGYEKINIINDKIVIPEGTQIDLGAIAKGYATDKLIDLFHNYGITSATISLGGNVYALGKKNGKNWKVAISSPFDSGEIYCAIEVSDKAVITSGQYQRFFIEDDKSYGHIIDPETGFPVDNEFASVTVIGENATECDALSTALFVMGKEKAIDYYERERSFDFVFILKDGSVVISQGINDSFELSKVYCESTITVIR